MTEAIEKLTPIDAINEFYKLKDKYKSGYYDKFIKPILNNKEKSKREKRVEYSKLPKPECINCKRNVETIFTIINTDHGGSRKFIAKCGDLSNPCPLDIQIDYSKRQPYYEGIKYGLKNIEELKLDIIKEKNNALFFEKQNDTISNFEKFTDSLKNETELTGILIEQDILKNDNPVKAELLKKTIDEFGKAFLIPFKKMVSDYMDTSNELILNQAIKFYLDEMVPKLKEIQQLRYDVNFVEYDVVTDEYTLIQRPNSLENKESWFEEDDKVLKFIKGMPKTSAKTKKVTTVLTAKNKTKKNVATLELVDELPEEQGQGQGQGQGPELQLKFREGVVYNKPRYEGPTGAIWDNKNYNEVWSSIPGKLKAILLTDKEWLEEYVNNCVNSKNNGKACPLFLPRTAFFPPKQLEDGNYDFGSEIVNKIFNKQNKQYQSVLLTLNNGQNDYTALKNTLVDLLEKEVGITFNNGYF